jgi:amyloid beta precursor protein binding protein 1
MKVLPTTAALVGGLVAQEAIKLITKQYSPLNGTCIVDLVKGGMTRYPI